MSHHEGFVIRFNNPRAILRDGSGKCFDLRYLRQSYPEEFLRLKGHTCQIKLGTSATWTVDDNGLGIVDICWDIQDADSDAFETSTIIKVLGDGSAAFAERPCKCSLHVSRMAVLDETGRFGNWCGTFQAGDVITHRCRPINEKLEASDVTFLRS
jgi:hypothetical protein